MRFVFDDRKTAQAACWLLKQAGGTLNYMVLIKLLYLADRKSLVETGAPITGDGMVSMPHGPVLSRTLDNINMGEPVEPDPPTAWYEYVSEPHNYEVRAKKEPETEELSRYELDVLTEIYERFGGRSTWSLRDYTHTLPEWVDPQGASNPIHPETILRAAGKSEAEIQAIVEDAEEVWFIRNLAATPH